MLLVALAVAALSQSPNVAEQAVIIAAVSDKLADGPSARWRFPKFSPSGKDWLAGTYCGWVNAKNRFGAYVGFEPFMVIAERIHAPKFTVSSVELSADAYAVVVKMCEADGYDLSEPPPAP